jgi:hypothetical protein
LLGEHGIQHDSVAGRERFERRLEERRKQETDGAEWEPLRRGWCLGPAAFKAQLLARMDGKLGEHHAGALKREAAEAKAERIIGEELRRLGWTERELQERPKSDLAKLAVAARVRRETTLTLGWLAVRLHLGSWKSFTAKLRRWKKTHEKGRQ